MKKKKSKSSQFWEYKVKRRIKRFIKRLNKSDFFNLYFLIPLLIILAIFFFIYLTNNLAIEKNMLLWFFAATSQSMAALFAVVGMFVVFRYQYLQTILRHQIEILRNNFLSGEWQDYFGSFDISIYTDSELLSKSEDLLEDKKEEPTDRAYNNLSVSVLVIRSNENIRDNIKALAKIPMIAVLITFLISVFSLLITNVYFSTCTVNSFGLAVILIMLILITFSMFSIFRFFMLSIPDR